MERTGERYGAARRVLVTQADEPTLARTWATQPETSDEAVRAATGRGWTEWCDLIEAWPGHADGHTAIAAYLEAEHGVDGWWAQSVTVGYERIAGLRLMYQQPDRTFTASKSATISVDAVALRELLLDDADRADLFPQLETELRSRPTSKAIRIAIGPGVAQIDIAPRDDSRATVSIAHAQLPSSAAVGEWKDYWSDWLAAIDEA